MFIFSLATALQIQKHFKLQTQGAEKIPSK
jgi:hypothetical protein